MHVSTGIVQEAPQHPDRQVRDKGTDDWELVDSNVPWPDRANPRQRAYRIRFTKRHAEDVVVVVSPYGDANNTFSVAEQDEAGFLVLFQQPNFGDERAPNWKLRDYGETGGFSFIATSCHRRREVEQQGD